MEKLVCVQDFETEAFKILDRNALDFFKSGADDEVTLRDNKNGFKKWIIRPRMLRNISVRDLSIEVFGKTISFPVGISPMGNQKLAHDDGELAMARAASAMDTIFILSTVSSTSIEEVAKASPNGRKWFQLYVDKDLSQSIDMIRRVESTGFEALVITVDANLIGKRRRNVRNNFHLPRRLKLANFDRYGTDKSDRMQSTTSGSALSKLNDVMKDSLTWKDIQWLKNNTKLPIIVKGIMTAEDASIAVDNGMAGILVSNHGGRQVDNVLATIDALQEVVQEVKGRCEVYCDGGISAGTDIFKALALGAKMVFVGRPLLWGLTVGGEQGVKRVLEILKEEFDLTMALSGVANVKSIDKNYVARTSNL